jgi:CHAT domain-containing protein/Tfp pilus assembly protein PilF
MEPGVAVEREIPGGAVQSFSLRIPPGDFLLLEIYYRGVSVSSKLLDAAGDVVATGEGTEGPKTQLLATIAGGGDFHRLEVTVGSPNLSGRYRITVRELRPAGPKDQARVEAARALTEARRLIAERSEETDRQAKARLEESLALWQSAGDAWGEVEAFSEIASHSEGRDPQAALGSYEKALARARASGFVEAEARILVKMGYCNSLRGNHDKAIALYEAALSAYQRIGGPFEQAYALLGLGNAHLRKGNLETALSVFKQAQPLAEASGDVEKQVLAMANIGACQLQMGHFSEALALSEKALELNRVLANPDTEASVEHNFAVIYQKRGQLQKAVDAYTRLVERDSSGKSGVQFLNLGSLYLELGDPEKALESYERARKAYQEDGSRDDEVRALVGIGSARQRMGDVQAALAEFEQARKLLPEETWNVPHYLGLALYASGKPAEALGPLERALGIARASRNSTYEASTLLALGTVYHALGQTDRAAESLGLAIDLATSLESPSILAPTLLQRAKVRSDQGRFDDARSDIENALKIVESTRQNIAGQQLRMGFFATKRAFYEFYINLLMRLDELHPKGDYKRQALEASERARARGLLDLLAEGRIDLSQGLDPDLRQQEGLISDELSSVQRELRTGNLSPERTRKLRAQLKDLDQRREQLDWEIRGRNKQYDRVRYPAPLDLSEIQSRLLDDRTALLEFALGEEGSTLFVITRETMTSYKLPAAGDIAKRVRRLRLALEKQSVLTKRDYLDLAYQLYQDLLAPASDALAGKPDLLIAPDGPLYYVPFEALLTEPAGDRSFRDLPYFLRGHSITYIPSASVLAGLREPREERVPTERKQIAVFAPFATSGSGASSRTRAPASANAGESPWSYEPLPASLQEASAIAGLYPGAALSFVAGAAGEDTVKHDPAVAAARRLHFATHAQVDERYPERSALVFSGNKGEDDGLLQVHEIFNLKLSADLAVLSACQTALGKEVTGEGLVGMTRAFFYAGVPSLVVSLWNVIDGSTPAFMLDFYKDLDRLNDKAKALQSAKLAMIERGSYSAPSYWAPFILIGEPR